MSYILEALKKSERKRPPGPVPDLFTVQGPRSAGRSRRPLLAVAVSVAIFVVAALGGWAWLGRRDRPASAPAPTGAQPERRASGGAPLEDATPGPAALAPPASQAPVVPSNSVTAKPAANAAPGRRPPGARPAGTKIAAPATAIVPAAQAPGATAPGAGTPTANSAVTAPVPAVAAAEPASPPPQDRAEVPPADGHAVGIEELPTNLRALLGSFAVTGHVWSEEPTLRLLTVQDRIVREGGEAAPGVRLEEITQTGAVFTVRGWRFRTGF
jgi:general secretion pathway protein B